MPDVTTGPTITAVRWTTALLYAAAAAACIGCTKDDGLSRELGAECRSNSDCADRCLPPGDDYPGGFCTLDCLSDSECPSDTACVAAEGGVCLFLCMDARDCEFLTSSAGEAWTCAQKDTLAGGMAFVCAGGN